MNEARRRRKAKQARRDARRATTREPQTPEETPLLDDVRQALAGHPLDLLGIVSMLIEATKPDPLAWLPSRPRRDTVEVDRLLDSFIGVHVAETTALLAVLAELLDDDDLQLRCRREVADRRDTLPDWVAGLGQVEVYRAVRMTHVLGDGDEILLGARLPSGEQLTCMALVDHNWSSVVKDAFPVPDSIDRVVKVAAQHNTDPDTSFVDMSLADARAWIEHGLAHPGAYLHESETWPGCRPILRWMIRGLPAGGARHESPDWDLEPLRELCDAFFASEHGAQFSRRDHNELLEVLLCDVDPVRWSVPRVERALGDSLYDDLRIPVDLALQAPALLASFIPFAHAHSGIRDELTVEALAAIDRVADSYRDAVLQEAAEDE